MRITSILMVGLNVLVNSPVFAATDVCGSMESNKERLACFEREASPPEQNKRKTKATDEKAARTFVDPVDALKIENDKVSARLKGICRGC